MNSAPPKPRTPAYRFGLALLLGLALAVPLFSVYLLIYDRQSQSQTARASIVEGWGDAQEVAGPYLVIPYSHVVETIETANGKQVTKAERRDENLFVAPAEVAVDTALAPQLRRRSIYEAVIYLARFRLAGRFTLPDFRAMGIDPATVRLDAAELRLGISGAKGLGGSQPVVSAGGRTLALIPGSALSQEQGSGFLGRLPLAPGTATVPFDIGFALRGNGSVTLSPSASDTRWHVASPWPHPSFTGGFLPTAHREGPAGFAADWRIGNLALNLPTVSTGEQAGSTDNKVTVALIDPVNLYDEVSRATKYGFLFIGFTFAALLMFDLLGGVAVPGPAYLLVGAGLVLFFVLLLALAEVIGFTPAYVIAAGGIVGLVSSYAAAILRSWRRGGIVAALLCALYGILYILLSLEAYALLIGSLLLFAALAGVMYVTRNLDWRAASAPGG